MTIADQSRRLCGSLSLIRQRTRAYVPRRAVTSMVRWRIRNPEPDASQSATVGAAHRFYRTKQHFGNGRRAASQE